MYMNFCTKCHQFRDPSLFVDSVCDYCNSNIEIYRQFNILNCPNCGLELIRYTGCSGMCCCLYGGHCQGYGYVCKHGYTDNVRFCGYRWDIRPSDDHESDDHESDDHESDDHESDDHESDDHGSDDHGSDDHGSDDHGSDDHESNSGFG